MKRSRIILSLLGLLSLVMVFALNPTAQTSQGAGQDGQRRKNGESRGALVGIQSVIGVTDSGWSTFTTTSDCATGQGDDSWQLTLTEPRNLTVTVDDCCCSGDYFEVRVDGKLIGTTPNLAPPWGCNAGEGPLSSGRFTVPLCPGVHTITVRDAGFDGHSLSEIQSQGMCPAGFTVTGSLAAPSAVTTAVTPRISIQSTKSLDDEAKQLNGQVEALAPFVVTNKDGTQRLLSDEARRAGIPGPALALGHQIVALNNRIVMAARRNEDPNLTASDFKFIEPLFLKKAQEPDPCGDRQHPTACPDRVDSGQFFATEEEVRQHLISLGYHQTAIYAGGGSGRDFTKVVDFPSCNGGPFRDQAIYFEEGNCWTYNTQGPEPNPEFLSYLGSWPYFSWPSYVRWWHLTFC